MKDQVQILKGKVKGVAWKETAGKVLSAKTI